MITRPPYIVAEIGGNHNGDVELVNGNVGYAGGVLTLPQWCAMWLPRIVSDFSPERDVKHAI